MEKCLTQTERQEKKTAIKYLRGELKERLDYLNGEPDNLYATPDWSERCS